MRIIIAIAVLGLSIGFAVRAHAAPPHTITWSPQNANPGDSVTIAGQTFLLVRTPVRDLGGSRRFEVSFLAPGTAAALFATLTTVHSRDPLPAPVIQIDGFDANLSITDGRSYTITTNFVSPGDYTFRVDAFATCSVTVKAGQTLITAIATIPRVQQPETDVNNVPNAMPVAEFADYIHPTAQVNGCNRWADYFRIQELP